MRPRLLAFDGLARWALLDGGGRRFARERAFDLLRSHLKVELDVDETTHTQKKCDTFLCTSLEELHLLTLPPPHLPPPPPLKNKLCACV